METDSNKDNTKVLSTSDVLSVICFVFTAYCILKLFQPSEAASMQEPSPGGRAIGSQDILRTSEVCRDEQYEIAEKGGEDSEEEKDGMRRNEWDKSFGTESGRTAIISLLGSEESGAGDSSEKGGMDEDGRSGDQEDGRKDQEDEEDEDKDDEGEEEAKARSSKQRGKTFIAYNTPMNPKRPKKQRVIKERRKPPPHLRIYNDGHYIRYDPVLKNHGIAVLDPFRHFGQYDGYALYINPDLKETELDQIPHFGVRVDDLTASKVLPHFNRKTLNKRWPAEFDRRGMIRATRVPLGRAAKVWVYDGERDVDGRWVEEEGWYYLSWGGIHTLMGKEGLDVDRYWVRPSHESFECSGLGFKIDWAEVQLAPEDPEDPTFL